MDGLIRFAAIMIILYMFGWLGKRGSKMVEKWFDNIAALFNIKRKAEPDTKPPDPEVAEERSKLQRSFRNPADFADFMKEYKISSREWEIIECVCDGLTNREIGDRVYVSLATVKDYLHKIFRKTGVANRVQLTNFIRNSIDRANEKNTKGETRI